MTVLFGYPGKSQPHDSQPELVLLSILSDLERTDEVGLALCNFSDKELRTAVREAAFRGIEFRLVLERSRLSTEQKGAPLLEELVSTDNVEIRVENPPSRTLHHKYMVVKGEAGSNWLIQLERCC